MPQTILRICPTHRVPRVPRYGAKTKGFRCPVCWNEKRRAKHRSDPRKAMLEAARHRAKVHNLPCTITLSDIKIPEVCPILGIPLQIGLGTQSDFSPSLDRLIPELGYVLGNIYVISYRANRIKNDASLAELEAVVRYLRTQEGQPW